MNTTITINQASGRNCRKLLTGIVGAGLLLGLTSCSTTRQLSQDPSSQSGFLGDYSMLKKGAKDEANYIYINPSVNFAKFTKIWIKPIELWHSDAPDSPLGKMSLENQQLLVNYFHTALVDTLQKEFEIVDQAGPGVVVMQAAVTEAKPSKPVLNLVTSAYLPLKAVSYGKRLATGTDIAVGSVLVEANFTDGQTGERVAAVMDARVGTKAMRSKFDGTWGDVKLAFDWWAQRVALRMSLLREGDLSPDKL
jgi:hypothetical protein